MSWYFDLGKKNKDLFKKGYPLKGAGELEVSLKAPNGVNFKTTVTKSTKGSLLAKLEDSVKLQNGVEIKGSISNEAKEGVTGQVSWNDLGGNAKGVKLIGSFASSRSEDAEAPPKRSIGLQLDYKHEKNIFTLSSLFKYFLSAPEKEKSTVFNSNASFRYDKYTIGGTIETRLFHEQTIDVTKYGVTVDYSNDNFSATGYSFNEKDEEDVDKAILGLSYWHKATDLLEVGADVFTDTNKHEPPKISVGAVYQADKYTTFRGKVDVAEASASLSYQQKVSDVATITLATEIPTKGGETKFGVGLAFSSE
eukprot:TRINITY_DN1147_c0_g1_i2.p1 TRINITY_DN1147_c0_g1~~TRINITY_DN1147_c0_g1_i2.p1  ORF type:complete len:344 (+),score=83.38 TRINITY_DN1147_c0_g1_i2:110-1033(+)